MTTTAGPDIIPGEAASLPELRAADQGVASALESVLAGNTQRVYGAQWRLFESWCGDVSLRALPAEPLTVARYLAARAGDGARGQLTVRADSGAWLAVQVMAHNLARWTTRIGLDEQLVTTKTLRRRFFSMAGRLTRSARRLTLHLPQRWPWENQFSGALSAADPPSGPRNVPANSRQVSPRASLAASCPDNLAWHHHRGPPSSPVHGYRTLHSAKSVGIKPSPSLSLASHPLPDRHGYIPSVDSGLSVTCTITRRDRRQEEQNAVSSGISRRKHCSSESDLQTAFCLFAVQVCTATAIADEMDIETPRVPRSHGRMGPSTLTTREPSSEIT